ncbi:MAG: acyltransferase [Rhodomicrobium sp.]
MSASNLPPKEARPAQQKSLKFHKNISNRVLVDVNPCPARFYETYAQAGFLAASVLGVEKAAPQRQRSQGCAFGSVPPIAVGGPGILGIGETAILGRVTIAPHADVTIGSRVIINDGVKLLTGSHNTADPRWRTFAEPIVIKDYARIAENAIILPGVTVGRGAVVGAGSVVREDVPDYCIAFGNHARIYPACRSPCPRF